MLFLFANYYWSKLPVTEIRYAMHLPHPYVFPHSSKSWVMVPSQLLYHYFWTLLFSAKLIFIFSSFPAVSDCYGWLHGGANMDIMLLQRKFHNAESQGWSINSSNKWKSPFCRLWGGSGFQCFKGMYQIILQNCA